MKLQGSCHCRAVRFTVRAASPCPFMRCYCSICRKTAGAGGYAINLGADRRSLQIEGEGERHIAVYRARLDDGRISSGERNFCRECGSALWLFDPNWPDLIHPHASAIDTPLPVPPDSVHIMLASKASWVQPDIRDNDGRYDTYPDESLADWHARHGL